MIIKTINIPYQMYFYYNYNSTFITINEPKLTHHNHPKSIVYIIVHSWCYTFYGFAQIYNIYQSLLCHTEYFHCSKNPLYSTRCKFCVWIHFFAYGCLVVLVPFVKKSMFAPLCCLCLYGSCFFFF